MARRKHRRQVQLAELDITAFMNLMIVLVPVLLLSMVFSHASVLDLNFPVSSDETLPQNLDENLQLQLIVRRDGLRVADSKAGLIKRLDQVDGDYDFDGLSSTLQQIKRQLPDKTDITILLEQDIDYQTLVTAMDTTRSYPAVVAANLVQAELFPDISIGDAPDIPKASEEGVIK